MNLRRTWAALAATAAGLLLAGLSACNTSTDPDADSTPTPTVEPTPGPEEDPDEAAVRDVVERFWRAYIHLQNDPPGEDGAFNGIVGPDAIFVEDYGKRATDYAELGFRRIGSPKISEPVLTSRGDVAYVVSQCFDETEWAAERNGDPVPLPDDVEPNRNDLLVEKIEGVWLVTDRAEPTGPDPCTS